MLQLIQLQLSLCYSLDYHHVLLSVQDKNAALCSIKNGLKDIIFKH